MGKLTARSEEELDAHFREAVRKTKEGLENARRRAAREQLAVRVDYADLCGVNGGDRCVVTPGGECRRELERFPEAERTLLAPCPELEPCLSLEQARPLLLRAAYNGLWSPSGTNWQPVRALELSSKEVEEIFARKGCGLVLLCPPRYESILGDIARLAGRETQARAEHIDLGIWLEAVERTALSHGWRLVSEPILVGRPDDIRLRLVKAVEQRSPNLPQESSATVGQFSRALSTGKLVARRLLLVQEGPKLALEQEAPGRIRPSSFDRLCEARSTQRVASPAGELDKSEIEDLFEQALRPLGKRASGSMKMACFSWRDEVPALVGRAMHRGLEDLLSAFDLRHLQRYLQGLASLSPELKNWASTEDPAPAADQVTLDDAAVPPHLFERLCQAGGYREEGGRLLDRRGRPLTPSRLCRLVALMARGFGKFFLSFQNTHPLLGVLLLSSQQEEDFVDLGRVVGRMTLLSRARGLVSIIKSGPLEIAGPAIREILDRAGAPAGEPQLVFQLGLPLGPEEKVAAGTAAEHDGLRERLLDRRAGRVRLSERYLPTTSSP